MKKMKFSNVAFILVTIAIIVGVFVAMVMPIPAPNNAASQYFCDAKPFAFTLNVDVENMSGEKLYNINGEFFAKYEDNLAMIDNNKNIVREMADDYNFITQNDHTILDGNGVLYVMEGNYKLFGDSYKVYDNEKNQVATINFDMFMTSGVMKDMDGNTIAQYDSTIFRSDYVVSVFDGCDIDDDSVLMMFASAHSDARSDSSD